MDFINSLLSDEHSSFTPEAKRLTDRSVTPEDLQRTQKWFSDRIGKVTGSITKDLMACTGTGSKKYPHWDMPEKIVDFGEGFKKQVFRMAMEKQYNTPFLKMDAVNFKYGRLVEPFIISQLHPDLKHTEVGSIDIIPDIFSASPDGDVQNTARNTFAAFEAKAAMTTDTVFTRIEKPFDEKHVDFWQIQSEMLALKRDKALYSVALPAKDINAILAGEPPGDHIPDVRTIIVNKSEVHCKALLERAEVAGKTRDIYLLGGNTIDECIGLALGA